MANEKEEKVDTPLSRFLESHICNRIKDRKPTPSERIMQLSMERDKIFDRIKDTEKELETVEKTEPDYTFIQEQLRYMKSYKDTLGNRIKSLVDKT